jgi:hypothetical protein
LTGHHQRGNNEWFIQQRGSHELYLHRAQLTGNANNLNYSVEVDPMWVRQVHYIETAYLSGVGVLELPPAEK